MQKKRELPQQGEVQYESPFERLLGKEFVKRDPEFRAMLDQEFKLKSKKLVKVDREVVRVIEVDEWWCAACGEMIEHCHAKPGVGVVPMSRRVEKEVRTFVTVEEWVDE